MAELSTKGERLKTKREKYRKISKGQMPIQYLRPRAFVSRVTYDI